MVEEDIHVPTSTMGPFTEAQRVDPALKYHFFEFVPMNYIPNARFF